MITIQSDLGCKVILHKADAGYPAQGFIVARKELAAALKGRKSAAATERERTDLNEHRQADHLTGTFRGCWFLTKHTFLWGWIDLLCWVGIAVFFLCSWILVFQDDYY